MTASKPIYKCPVCGYETHFPKALEAHMKIRKHRTPQPAPAPAAPVVEVKEEPAIVAEEAPSEKTVKKTRKPRAKKNAESEA